MVDTALITSNDGTLTTPGTVTLVTLLSLLANSAYVITARNSTYIELTAGSTVIRVFL